MLLGRRELISDAIDLSGSQLRRLGGRLAVAASHGAGTRKTKFDQAPDCV
jgi:hypothetical protein